MSARPDRSDARLSPEAEAAREAEVREYFDGAAPKRHTKPSRSDHSAVYTDALVPDDAGRNCHPELDKFQELEAHTEKLVHEGGEMSEEFVETEYYKDLGCVGKQHHTTGTGFIKMDKAHGASFELHEDRDGTERHASCKGNPATNEWIPSADTYIRRLTSLAEATAERYSPDIRHPPPPANKKKHIIYSRIMGTCICLMSCNTVLEKLELRIANLCCLSSEGNKAKFVSMVPNSESGLACLQTEERHIRSEQSLVVGLIQTFRYATRKRRYSRRTKSRVNLGAQGPTLRRARRSGRARRRCRR